MERDFDFVWRGERNRRLDAYRPCACGTCSNSRLGVGYLSSSDTKGRGFTVWIVKEEAFQRLSKTLAGLYGSPAVRRRVADEGQISLMARAEVILGSHSRCEKCGKSVENDGITLVVDHKKPPDSGGINYRDNLWAICETECGADTLVRRF